MSIRVLLLLFLPLFAVVPIIAAVRYIWAIILNPARAWRIIIGLDQLTNVSANGSEDETISSRAARSREKGEHWACVLCRILDVFEKDHCTKSLGT